MESNQNKPEHDMFIKGIAFALVWVGMSQRKAATYVSEKMGITLDHGTISRWLSRYEI